MKPLTLGLLGDDPGIAAVAAAARAAGDRVVVAGETAGALLPWSALLDEAVCDAVLVGGDGWNPARAEAVRVLVQAGRTLLLGQPLELSMLWAYEIDMVGRDSGAVLVPCLPDRLQPAVAELKRVLERGAADVGPLGRVESVRLERALERRTRDGVLSALSRDVDLVRALVGDPARLATLGATDPETAWATLEVGFSGQGLVPARWQVTPAGSPGLTITLQAARGSCRVQAPDDAAQPWTWTVPEAGSSRFDRGAAMLAVLRRALGHDEAATAADAIPPATWADAARALDLAEAVPRSLAKGRAIDLHREEFSEIGTFRGTMASLGCGLVLLALVVLLVATLVGGIASELDWEFGKAVSGAWPVVVLAVLALFLGLQLLPLLVGAGRPGRGRDGPPAGP